jgi:tRNA pseudouridine55 synthase
MKQKPIHPAMQPYLEGKMILIDKPLQWTSFNAVKKVRILTGVNKVGHAGTLDPLATGLLIICTGKFTKKINEYMGMDKEYTGTFILGASTASFDLETEPENFIDTQHLTQHQIQDATKNFLGIQQQMPPMHSAIKKDGKPLYLSARKGITVEVEPRTIRIHQFNITAIRLGGVAGQPIEVDFSVVCSTGTYIRSLANDFGKLLGVGGYLSALRRTKIGDFNVDNAWQIPHFETAILQEKEAFILP